MPSIGERVLMRIYLDSADRAPRTPSYELIVKRARQQHMAGATVLRGILGLRIDGDVLQPSAWKIVEHVPVIVEIVDEPVKIETFLQSVLDELDLRGLVTTERVDIVLRRPGYEAAADSLNVGGSMATQSTGPGELLRIMIGESDTEDGKPLYETIVRKARELGLAGATVLRGIEGFGAQSVIHKAGLLDLSTDLPIVIEIVDSAEKVRALLPYLESVVKDGLITSELVTIVVYRGRGKA